MKFGMRTPRYTSPVKKMQSKAKRQIKSAVNPLYGKKGMGIIKNPKKALYNKAYKKTTFSVDDLIVTGKCKKITQQEREQQLVEYYSKNMHIVKKSTYLLFALFLGWMGAHKFYAKRKTQGVMYLIFCWTLVPLILGWLSFILNLFKPSDIDGRIMV